NTSKGGVLMLMKSMAVDLAHYGLRANAIAPGTIKTPITEQNVTGDNCGVSGFAFPPASRWGEAVECASAIVFLASSNASYITGSTITIDGGQTSLNGVINGS